jgi:hypothetical protein
MGYVPSVPAEFRCILPISSQLPVPSSSSPLFPDLPGSRAEVFVEEGADFAEGFFRFGSLIVELVLSVRLAFEDLQLRIDARLAEFAMHANGVAQQQVAGAGGEDGRR